MSLGNPFFGNTGSINLSGVGTTASNTTFPTPVGSDVWVVNNNSATAAFVLLTTNAANSTANTSNGVPIPPNMGVTLKAPWPASYSGTAIISVVVPSGTTNIYANAGYGRAT
jgi:hypothetical protein